MRPIFTVHAGEYLGGSAIEKMYPRLRVWVPSKDTGIDLLVTSADCKKTVSLQVKFSKDFLAKGDGQRVAKGVKSGGWWTFDTQKMQNSPADYWILVLYNFQSRVDDFVIIKPCELFGVYNKLSRTGKTIHSYIWVTSNTPSKCWETRGLNTADKNSVAQGKYNNQNRDLTKYLNDWAPIAALQ